MASVRGGSGFSSESNSAAKTGLGNASGNLVDRGEEMGKRMGGLGPLYPTNSTPAAVQ
jgi:hypothetical protein